VRIYIETLFLRVDHRSAETVIYARLIRIYVLRALCEDFNEALGRVVGIELCFAYSTNLAVKEFKIGDYCHFAFHL
jgi:hypothetical protein